MAKIIATKNVTVSIKEEDKKAKTVILTKGKVVTPSVLKKLTKSQIERYTQEEGIEEEKLDVSHLSPEDQVFYRKNKSHPDIEFALSFMEWNNAASALPLTWMDQQMKQETYQTAVDKMGETYFNRLSVLVDENRIADSDAVYSEWVVDGQDPEDGSYEFTFIPCLSEWLTALPRHCSFSKRDGFLLSPIVSRIKFLLLSGIV